VDADLGELSLSGDVEVTVGRYRLGGDRVRLRRGPRGIGVEGGGDIAFCSCDHPPITLGYRSVTIAPPSDVLIQHAVVRAFGVPVFWSPYLWLRSPDRVALLFPSVEWRGQDGLLLGSGIHVPFSANQGRPAPRALDVSGFGYTTGGARVEARLLTPSSSSLVRWDYRGASALTIDAHGAAVDRTTSVWAYDADASFGPRGRTSLSSLDAAARRYDHVRFGVGSQGTVLFALGAGADAPRAVLSSGPIDVGPFGMVSTGGAIGARTSYGFDLAASSSARVEGASSSASEQWSFERSHIESTLPMGPVLGRAALFERAELTSAAALTDARLRAGTGLTVSLPLVRRTGDFAHLIAPEALARIELRRSGDRAERDWLATAGMTNSLGGVGRGGAARVQLAFGAGGRADQFEPLARAALGVDTRLLGLRATGVGEPRTRAAEGTARLRIGPRGGTNLTSYAEARTRGLPVVTPSYELFEILPPLLELGGYDRNGLTTGADISFWLAGVVVGGGGDVDPMAKELLSVRSFARYRHRCGCVAVSGLVSSRKGRGGFDASLAIDLMP